MEEGFIQTIPLTSIRPYWRNPRKADQAAVEAVAESILKYGFNQPLVVDSENVIIVGHTRYRALMLLGVKEVPCIVKDLTPEQAKEYRIVDNKTNEGSSWDWGKLVPELRTMDMDAIKPFFSDVDLDSMMQVETSAAPSAESIEHAGTQLEGRMQRDNASAMEDYLSIMCPHCGESFSILRSDMRKPE